MNYLEEYKKNHSLIKYYCVVVYKILWKGLVEIYKWWQRQIGVINDRDIVFMSTPDYSDNAKALSEYLEKNGYADKYTIYWLVGDVEKIRAQHGDSRVIFLPRYGRFHNIPLSSLKAYMHAHYLVSTHGSLWHKGDAIKGQVDFCLWHGCGYKDKNTSRVCDDVFDKCLVPGPLFVKTKSRYWRISEDFFIPSGYPRYDWLMHPGNKATELRNLFLGKNSKLIIWMPTFRNVYGKFAENSITQFPLMVNENDWKTLDGECQKRKVIILVKLHQFQKPYDINFGAFKNIKEINNSTFDKATVNLYEFLAVTDALISDYSSVSFDYLIVDKPIAYALDDYEAYKEARGFVFDNPKEYMPGHHLYRVDDLIHFVDDLYKNNDPYKAKRQLIRKEAIHESAHYCQDVVSAIGLNMG